MIVEQIDADLKSAMREKNEVALMSLRNLKSALKNAEIELAHPLTDAEALKVVAKKIKQHKDSIESFTSGNRPDLAEIEKQQLAILEKYQPAQMSEDEVRKIVQECIASMNATPADFGKVMKEVMAKTAGQADGTLVSKLVKDNLK